MSDVVKMMSSIDQDWATPKFLIDAIEEQVIKTKFDLDVCAYPHTAKAERYYTEEDDAFTKEWDAEFCWMNPPYGSAIPKWLDYARVQAEKHNNIIVCLVPSRTDTKWFHDIACKGEILLMKARVPFERANGKETEQRTGAFGSMLVIYGREHSIKTWRWRD